MTDCRTKYQISGRNSRKSYFNNVSKNLLNIRYLDVVKWLIIQIVLIPNSY